MIKIFAYVVGENKYKFKPSVGLGRWGTEENAKRCKEICSKKVKCLNDNMEFSSMNDASRYYGISRSSITVSVKNNKKVLCKKDNQYYQFILC